MEMLSTEVLIIGAGPAGLATAIGLAERRVGFVIIDALPDAQNTSRAAVIHAATLESLKSLGVADRLVEQGIKVPHFRVRDRDTVLFSADFADLPTTTSFALMIPQDETEQILIDRLAELGHTVRRPVQLARYELSAQGVRAACESDDGRFVVEARYIVGADGEKSTVRAGAKIDFPGETYGSFLLADVRMDWPIDRQEVTLFFSNVGALVVAPMSYERFRVVAQLADAPSIPTLEDVQEVIETRGPRSAARVREILWGSRFQVHHKLAERLHQGPVVLVGDAAHVHSPAGGQGMNLGLRDAEMLSRALAEALLRDTEAPLAAYSFERRQAATKVLAKTDRLTKVATMRSPAMKWTRNRLIATASLVPTVRRTVACTLAGFR